MLLTIISLLALVTIVADILHIRRSHRRKHSLRIPTLIGIVISDLLLPAVAIVAICSQDNTTAFMRFAMWMFWFWMLFVLPRMIHYLFRLLRLPRVGYIAAGIVALILIWGATIGRTSIQVNRIEITSDRLPKSFDGLRIVQLSDIHIGTLVCPERELQRIVDSVAAQHPDLIIFTGDLVNIRASELDVQAQRPLSSLHAPMGVYSVLGNHDVGTYIRNTAIQSSGESLTQLIEQQKQMGWQLLQDTTVFLHRNNERIALSGISFDPALRKLRHDPNLPPAQLDKVYRDVPDSLYNITAVHLPQLWSQITQAGYGDLTLSGHVHAMQMKLRLFGRDFSPSQWLYKRWSGRYDNGRHTLYINDGIGYVAYPMRLGAWPEITLFTLRCSQPE